MRAPTRAATGVGAVVLAALSFGVFGAVPAQAASSGISLSLDGASYAPTITAPLFGSSSLVPNASVTRSFWVRNDSPAAGYLRLTVRDPSMTNLDFADALSLRADLIGWPGESVPLRSARPCSRLSEGPIVAAGTAARVDLTAALGDLDGSRGQGGGATFTVVVSLSGEPQGLGRSGCPTSGSSFAGFPDSAAAVSRPRQGAAVIAPAAGVPLPDTVTTTTVQGGSVTGPSTPSLSPQLVASSNTSRFYQERDIGLWLAALLIGGLGAQLLGLRRRRSPSGAHPHHPIRPAADPTHRRSDPKPETRP